MRLDKVEQFISVDSVESIDLDDGFNISKKGDDWILNIFIANPASALSCSDELVSVAEAKVQTVYRKNRIKSSMLPEDLVETELSLLPGKLLKPVKVTIRVSKGGAIELDGVSTCKAENIAKLAYSEVSTSPDIDEKVNQWIKLGVECTKTLFHNRVNQIDGLVVEENSGVYIDEHGQAQIISLRDIHGHILVQEMMILCNKVLALYAKDHELNVIFRIHQQMTLDEFKKANPEFRNTYELITEHISPNRFKTLYHKAKYSVHAGTHAGLNLECYATFSSPLRRFVDLYNQFVLLSHLNETEPPESFSNERCEKLNHILANDESIRGEGSKKAAAHTALKELNACKKISANQVCQIIKRIKWPGAREKALQYASLNHDILLSSRFWLTLIQFPQRVDRKLGELLLEKLVNRQGLITSVFNAMLVSTGTKVLIDTRGDQSVQIIELVKKSLYLDVDFFPTVNLDEGKALTEEVVENFKGKFLEIANVNQWLPPKVVFEADGPSHLLAWTAILSFTLKNETFSCKHTSLVKKQSEQLCYKELYLKLSRSGKIIQSTNQSSINRTSDNSKSALNELIQKDSNGIARYETKTVPHTSPLFESEVFFAYQGRDYCVKGSSFPSKKEAEKDAANVALSEINVIARDKL